MFQSWVDQYFERMEVVMHQPGLASRIKFLIQDVLELRANSVSGIRSLKNRVIKLQRELLDTCHKLIENFASQNPLHFK